MGTIYINDVAYEATSARQIHSKPSPESDFVGLQQIADIQSPVWTKKSLGMNYRIIASDTEKWALDQLFQLHTKVLVKDTNVAGLANGQYFYMREIHPTFIPHVNIGTEDIKRWMVNISLTYSYEGYFAIPFGTNDVFVNRLQDWSCWYRKDAFSALIMDDVLTDKARTLGTFYRYSDYGFVFFNWSTPHDCSEMVITFDLEGTNIRPITSYDSSSFAVVGYIGGVLTEKYCSLRDYITHDTYADSVKGIRLQFENTEQDVDLCESVVNWSINPYFDNFVLEGSDKQEGNYSIKAVKNTLQAATRYTLQRTFPSPYLDVYDQNWLKLWVKWTTSAGTVPDYTRFRVTDSSGNEGVFWLGWYQAQQPWYEFVFGMNVDIQMVVGSEMDWHHIANFKIEWETGVSVQPNDTLTLYVDWIQGLCGLRSNGEFVKDQVIQIRLSFIPLLFEYDNNNYMDARIEWYVDFTNFSIATEPAAPEPTYLPLKEDLGTSTDADNFNWLTPDRIVQELRQRGYKHIYHYFGMSLLWQKTQTGALDTTATFNYAFEEFHRAFFKELKEHDMDIIVAFSEENNVCPDAWAQRDYEGVKGYSYWMPESVFVSPSNTDAITYYKNIYKDMADILYEAYGANDLNILFGEPFWWFITYYKSKLTQNEVAGQKLVHVADSSKFSAGQWVLVRDWTVSEYKQIDYIDGNIIHMTANLDYTYQTFYEAEVFDYYGMDFRPFFYDQTTKDAYYAEYGVDIEQFESVYDDYSSENAQRTIAFCMAKLNDWIMEVKTYLKTSYPNLQYGVLTDKGYSPSGIMHEVNDLDCYYDSSLDFLMIEHYAKVDAMDWDGIKEDCDWANTYYHGKWHYLTGIIYASVAENNAKVCASLAVAKVYHPTLSWVWSYHQEDNYAIEIIE